MATRRSLSPRDDGHPTDAHGWCDITHRAVGFLTALVLCALTSARPSAAQTKPNFLREDIDSSVSPREDFFQYANGAWLKRNPIPAQASSWGIGNVVAAELDSRLRRISEDAAAGKAPKGSLKQLVGDFWYTGMDSVTIQRKGLTPLQPDFDRIDRIRTIGDVMDEVAVLHSRDQRRVLFIGRVEQDEKNSDRWTYSLVQGGITMNPPFYTSDDPQRVRMREAFRQYLFRTFLRLQHDSGEARRRADEVYALESELAKGFEPAYAYQRMTPAELGRVAPSVDWNRYLRGVGITSIDSVNLRSPKFFHTLDTLLQATPIDTWKDYLRHWLVRLNLTFLDDETRLTYFEFDRVGTGASVPRPRWQRVLSQEKDFYLGEPMARLYEERYSPKSVAGRYRAVGEALRAAFRQRIEHLDWMSDSTKRSALRKLAHLKIAIGAPEHRMDFSSMPLRRDSYVLNAIRAGTWYHERDVGSLNRPVDRRAADLRPGFGEGTYLYTNNEVLMRPSPILVVPGLRDEDIDDAVVYGAPYLAHEIAHAFDSEGSHYDAVGNKVDWWTTADETAFRQRVQALVDEYNTFPLPEGRHVNGETSLRENMADLVGLRVALDAFKHTRQFRKNERIAGFTPLQRFFLAYAYGRMYSETSSSLAGRVNGAYPPNHDRVNGVLMNIPEFYEAFGVKPGDRMFLAEDARVRIW